MTHSTVSSTQWAPRYATPRRPERLTYGSTLPVLAGALGVHLMPWQRHAADLIGELAPDPETGELIPAYSTVVLSVPRRAGKTLLILLLLLRVILAGRRRRAWYTAQARADAVVTLRDEWSPIVAASPLAHHVGIRLSNGSEALTLTRLASTARLFAPIPAALHGQAGDLIVFDEAWSHSVERGRQLEIASRPLTATRPGAQTVIVSAAGDIDSTWWTSWLEVGRLAAAADLGHGVAHIEWSADAHDVDHADPATWTATHPAVRHAGNPTGTIPLSFLADEYRRDPAGFVRLYLNVTDRTGITGSPIDPATWARLGLPAAPAFRDPVVFAVDAAPDQTAAAIVAAVALGDGTVAVELVDHRPGLTWATDRLIELCDRWNPVHVTIDPGAPAGAIVRDLRVAGIPLHELDLRDVTAAAAGLVEAVRTGTVRPVDTPAFTAAVDAVRRRLIGDGSWAFGRRDSTADVCPLVAASFAWWSHPATVRAAPAIY